jgi:tetratricopeptide (TPR) repeat protein
MARNKPRKPAPAPVKLAPEKYIQTKARSLPVHECLINPDWQSRGLATVMVSRKQPSGNIIAGVYLVDVLCLGLKNTYHFFNETARYYEEELKDLVFSHQEYEPCDYVLAHNIVYGAIAYAEDLGFKAHKDFGVSRYVLEEDDESVELLELEFGRDGQPCYIVGPYDNASLIVGKLRAAVGEGNFTVVYPDFDDEFDDEDDDFGEDDGEDEDNAFDEYEEVEEDGNEEEDDEQDRPAMRRNGYEIIFEAMFDTRYREYFEQLGDQVAELNRQAKQEPEKAIPALEKLILQYPRFPILQNYLVAAYTLVGRKEEADALVEQMFLHFPDYLLARVAYARMFLEKGDLQRVGEVLENKFDIKQVYPERDMFHYTEVLHYTGIVAEYLIERGETDRAQRYVTLMEDIDLQHPLTRRAVHKLMSSRLGGGIDLSRFFGKS